MTPGNRIGVCSHTGHEEFPFSEVGELLRRVAGIEAGAGCSHGWREGGWSPVAVAMD